MQIPGIPNRFLKDNIYLLFISLLLLAISVFTGKAPSAENLTKKYTDELQNYIHTSEKSFETLVQNKSEVDRLISAQKDFSFFEKIADHKQHLFVYKNIKGFTQLTFWSTQNIIPDDAIVTGKENYFFRKLVNGYFFIQKKETGDRIIVSLTPVKWQYSIESNYLANDFCINPSLGANFEISFEKNNNPIVNSKGAFLFSLKNINPGEKSNSSTTIWLRIFSLIPLLLFLHFSSVQLYKKRGFLFATTFLFLSLIILRSLTYYFFKVLQLDRKSVV